MVEWIKEQAEVLQEANIENGRHIGPVRHADELHALQSLGRGKCAIHLQAALSRPLIIGERANVTYRNGRGAVKQEQGRDKSRGGR